MAPIAVRLAKKEKERDRVRNLARDEEHERTSHLNAFKNDVRVLQDIEQQIKSGRYRTASELMRTALRKLQVKRNVAQKISAKPS